MSNVYTTECGSNLSFFNRFESFQALRPIALLSEQFQSSLTADLGALLMQNPYWNDPGNQLSSTYT